MALPDGLEHERKSVANVGKAALETEPGPVEQRQLEAEVRSRPWKKFAAVFAVVVVFGISIYKLAIMGPTADSKKSPTKLPPTKLPPTSVPSSETLETTGVFVLRVNNFGGQVEAPDKLLVKKGTVVKSITFDENKRIGFTYTSSTRAKHYFTINFGESHCVVSHADHGWAFDQKSSTGCDKIKLREEHMFQVEQPRGQLQNDPVFLMKITLPSGEGQFRNFDDIHVRESDEGFRFIEAHSEVGKMSEFKLRGSACKVSKDANGQWSGSPPHCSLSPGSTDAPRVWTIAFDGDLQA